MTTIATADGVIIANMSLNFQSYASESDIIGQEIVKCPGLYCGRLLQENNEYSECQACPWGYRSNFKSVCLPCSDTPSFYDWLYLGFMALLSLLLHWLCIDITTRRKGFTRGVIVLHISAISESVLAALATILVLNPLGSLSVKSCQVLGLSDWYTMLYNPRPTYTNTLHCTQEAVYPLYTMVLIYYAFSVGILMLIRPILVAFLLPGKGAKSIYAALYFLPGLVVLQALFGGLIYYSFPYILLVLSLISNAVHFSTQLEQSMSRLIVNNVSIVKNLGILFLHWGLHAYGIISITQLQDITKHAPLVALVPAPAIFYILTVHFTDPGKLNTLL